MARRGTARQDEWSTGFMSLDRAAEHANETGWTREAKKAERNRLKAEKRAARKAKAKADRRAFFGAVGNVIADIWDFLLRNIVLALALGGSIATGAWEWVNSGRGWLDLYPGVGIWTYVGSAGGILIWYLGFRRAREEAREPKATRSWFEVGGWGVAAFTGYAVLVAGVFIATATNQVEAQRAAKESRKEYVALVVDRDKLKAHLEVFDVEYWDQMIVQGTRAIEQLTNNAKGSFDMPDLEVAGGCAAAKLNFNQRRLCARMNGGIDEFSGETVKGLRAEFEQSQRGRAKAVEDEKELANLNAQIKAFKIKTGDETAEAVGAMFAEETSDGDASRSLGWVLLALSSLFLIGSGWATDWALETIERKRKMARAKKGKP